MERVSKVGGFLNGWDRGLASLEVGLMVESHWRDAIVVDGLIKYLAM